MVWSLRRVVAAQASHYADYITVSPVRSVKKFYRHSSLELARRMALGEIHQKPARITLERQAKPGEHACLDGSFRPLSYPVDMEGRLWEECVTCSFLHRLTPR